MAGNLHKTGTAFVTLEENRLGFVQVADQKGSIPTEETALNELELFKDKWDSKYPKIYKSWHD